MLPYLASVRDWRPPTRPAADGRLVADRPAHGVDAVHGLLDDVVAREPAVVVPVAHLVLHVGRAFLAGLPRLPDALRVVGRLDGDDVADLAVEDLLHGLAAGAVVAPAEAVDDARGSSPWRPCTASNELAEAGAVDGHRLLDERVDPFLDGVGQVDRPEMRGRRQEDDVDLVDDLLVGVEARRTGDPWGRRPGRRRAIP